MKQGGRIALYGLGTETERAIQTLDKQYEIVGLLDGFKTEGELFGKRIISLQKAIDYKVEKIIVIARPGSCKAIKCRIGESCKKNKIELYDIRGVDLLNQEKNIYEIDKLVDIAGKSTFRNTDSDNIKYELFREKINTLGLHSAKCVISNVYDIGYLFFAPLITDFVLWFYNHISIQSIKNVWFSARDGFLIKQLFEILDKEFQTTYFLTSRCAAIRAGISNEEDIKYVDSMHFSGELSENLKIRFGIDAEVADDVESLMEFKNEILIKVKESKKGYHKYLEKLCIRSGDIALFDFVAKGTTQYFIEKLVINHIKGFYFLQLEPEFMLDKNLDIISFYSSSEFKNSAIYDDYYILETILTSAEPMLIDFEENGNPIYANETRTKNNIDCFFKVQEGIIDYFKDYVSRSKQEERLINRSYDEIFLKLIHNVEIKDNNFLELRVEDPFFNRITNINEIL